MKRMFSTYFPINESTKIEDLRVEGMRWVSNSPHNEISYENLEGLLEHGNVYQDRSGNFVKIGKMQDGDTEILGIRYDIEEKKGDRWHGIVVGEKNPDQFFVSVTADFETINPRSQRRKNLKPIIVNQIIENFGGGRDGDLYVGHVPFFLNEDEGEFVSDMLLGEVNSILPIVYISRDNFNNYVGDPVKIASKLAGIAHVLVEPSRQFSFGLKNLMNGKNAYDGAVGIYWPEGMGANLLLKKDLQRKRTEEVLFNLVAETLQSRHIPRSLTWENIESLKNREAMQNLRDSIYKQTEEAAKNSKFKELAEKHKVDLDDLYDLYDSEINDKSRQLEMAQRRISDLEIKLRGYSNKTGVREGILLYPQTAQFYDGEKEEVIVDALKYRLDSCKPLSRRAILLQAVLDANQIVSDRDSIVKSIKSIFKSYRRMDGNTRMNLRQLGFQISEGGKHYRLYRENEGEDLFVTVPKTPSDARSGKNTSKQIIETFF